MKSNLALAIAFDQMQATVKVKEELKACSTWAEIKVAVAKQENERLQQLRTRERLERESRECVLSLPRIMQKTESFIDRCKKEMHNLDFLEDVPQEVKSIASDKLTASSSKNFDYSTKNTLVGDEVLPKVLFQKYYSHQRVL